MSDYEEEFESIVKSQLRNAEEFEAQCYAEQIMANHPTESQRTQEAFDEVTKILEDYDANIVIVVAILLIESILYGCEEKSTKFVTLSTLKFYAQSAFDNHIGRAYREIRDKHLSSSTEDFDAEIIRNTLREN